MVDGHENKSGSEHKMLRRRIPMFRIDWQLEAKLKIIRHKLYDVGFSQQLFVEHQIKMCKATEPLIETRTN